MGRENLFFPSPHFVFNLGTLTNQSIQKSESTIFRDASILHGLHVKTK
jgi:hypothetical protein